MPSTSQRFIVEKPTWPTSIQAEHHPIYTLDVHPDGSRFAIALFKDGYIFSTSKLYNIEDGNRERVQLSNVVELEVMKVNPQVELLAKLDNHMMAINCMRFSPNGRYISCASDDQKVSLYLFEPGATPGLMGGGSEKWRCVKLFGGHTKDVLAIDWSPDSKYLVSCGVDNNICVYDVEKRTQITTLSMDGIVKGIVWDPIGKYVLSQGDRSAVVWASNTWSQVNEFTVPYAYSHGDNMFYRPSWSPDGDFIVTGNGVFQKRHVAPIFSRKDFSNTNEFSGHKDVVVVARYSPIIYEDSKNEKGMVTVVALGSMDNSITVWATNAGKPLFYAPDIVKQGISDIAWSKNGNSVIVSSADGSISVLHFPDGFLGTPMSSSRASRLMREKYGDVNERTLLEAPMIEQTIDLNDSDDDMYSSQPITSPPPIIEDSVPVSEKQKEVITKEGKRRITPVVSAVPAISHVVSATRPTRVDVSSLESRMTEGSNVLYSTSHFDKEKVAPPNSVNIVSRKRVRPEEAPESQPKRARRETTSFEPEDLYVKVNSTDELKCSVQGEVQYLVNSTVLWSANLGEAPVSAAANSNFVAVATQFNCVHIYSKAGRRLFAPIILDSLPQHISCNRDKHLVIMTSEKMVYLWDVFKPKCIVQCSADHIIHRVPHEVKFVDDVGLSSTGVPVITLNTGESYLYNKEMKTWICVADSHAPLSSFVSSATHLYENTDNDEIYENITYQYLKTRAARLAEQHRIEMLERDDTGQNRSGKQSAQTIEDLEIALASTSALRDSSAYLQFLEMYFRFMSRNSDTYSDRLRDICDFLLGPVVQHGSQTRNSEDWDPEIAGLSKHLLLRKALAWIGKNLDLQRIINEYRDILDELV